MERALAADDHQVADLHQAERPRHLFSRGRAIKEPAAIRGNEEMTLCAIGLLRLLLPDAVPARNPFGMNVARVEAQGGAVIQGDARHRDEHEEDERGEADARMPASQGPNEA